MKSRVVAVDYLCEHTFLLSLTRPDVSFYAGQFFSVGIAGVAGIGVNREYSVCSAVSSERLEFLIRNVEGGVLSPILGSLEVGVEVEIEGPFGSFGLEPEKVLGNRFFFVATGTGIAPFASIIRSYPAIKADVLHGVRFSNEDYFSREIDFKITCVSSGGAQYSRVTDALKHMNLPSAAQYMLCGNREMIIDSTEILLGRGISADQVTTEVFF